MYNFKNLIAFLLKFFLWNNTNINFYPFIYLNSSERETASPICWFTLQMSTTARIRSAKAEARGSVQASTTWVAGTQCEPLTAMGCGHLKWRLNCNPKWLPNHSKFDQKEHSFLEWE